MEPPVPLSSEETPPPLPTDDTVLLLHYLQTHDAPCPLCKYNLRNLTQPRCPECGRALKITVGMVEPLLWPYVILLTSLLLPAGMGILIVGMTIKDGFHEYEFIKGLELALFIAFQVYIVPAGLMIFLRRWFLKLSPAVQKGCALGGLFACIVLYALFFWQMR